MDNNDTTFINLFTTGQCQHMCWYCIEDCNEDRLRQHMSLDTFSNVIEFIKTQDKPNVHFHFYGGEPLLHPDIWKMTDALRLNFDSIKFKLSTNLNHPHEVINKIPRDFSVFASLHSDFVSDYMDWFINAKWVQTNCILEETSLMVQKRNIAEMIILYELWHDQLPVTMFIIDQYIADISVEAIELMVTEGFQFHHEDNCGTHGCLCSAGWDIDEHGEVTKCSAHKDNVLLNVNENILKLPQWGICPDAKNCPCDVEFLKKHVGVRRT